MPLPSRLANDDDQPSRLSATPNRYVAARDGGANANGAASTITAAVDVAVAPRPIGTQVIAWVTYRIMP